MHEHLVVVHHAGRVGQGVNPRQVVCTRPGNRNLKTGRHVLDDDAGDSIEFGLQLLLADVVPQLAPDDPRSTPDELAVIEDAPRLRRGAEAAGAVFRTILPLALIDWAREPRVI